MGLLAIGTVWWRSSALALVRSSYQECTIPWEVMRLGGQGQGICSESIEGNIKHKKDGIIKR